MNILRKANEIINERSEEKEREYGPFIECNERAAKFATLLTNKEVTTLDIYHFQIALKLAREAYAHKEDNLLDVVAYIGALNNFHNGVEPEAKKVTQEEQDSFYKEIQKLSEHWSVNGYRDGIKFLMDKLKDIEKSI